MNQYRVQVTEEGAAVGGPVTSFSFESHDDLRVVLEKVGEKKLFDEEETKAFCTGLKIFTGIALKHRSHPLFAELGPHLGEFMKKLKGTPAPEAK